MKRENTANAIEKAIEFANVNGDIRYIDAEENGEYFEIHMLTSFGIYDIFVEASTLEAVGFDFIPCHEEWNSEIITSYGKLTA